MDLEAIWKSGILISLAIFGATYFTFVFCQIIYYIINWIDDFESRRKTLLMNQIFHSYACNDSGGDFAEAMIVVLVLGGLSSVIWILSVPVGTILGLVHMLRGLTRFKKKVNRALKLNESD